MTKDDRPQLPGEPTLDEILSLAKISAYAGLRDEPGLKAELESALQQGISILLIRETILQTYLFAGYPAAINAFIVLNELTGTHSDFLREDGSSPEVWNERGEALSRKIYGSQFEKLMKNMNYLHPDLAEWMIQEGYGKVLARPFLSPRVRELVIVGMTAVLKVERQFHSHVRGSIHVGATKVEIRQILDAVGATDYYKDFVENLLV
jgi:4-carboxymuconolactone decarboxylase